MDLHHTETKEPQSRRWIQHYQYGGELCPPWLKTIMDWILENGTTPKSWKYSRTTLLHKGGNTENLENYRGITVCSVTYLIFTSILQFRMAKVVEENEILGPLQHGFQRNKSTTDALFILSQMLENRSKTKSGVLTFIDLRKAYYSVPWYKLWQTLEKLGFNGLFSQILQNLYTDCWTVISCEKLFSGKYT